MPTPQEVASLYGVLSLRDEATGALRTFDGGLSSLGDRLSGIGGSIQGFGAQLTALTAPLGLLGGSALKASLSYQEAITNIRAVTLSSAEATSEMSARIFELGRNSRFGAQGAADAFYDIVGGVSDATTWMAILEQSIHAAQAGNADLGETTNALISVMNSYGFSANDAAYASDVLTRTVGMGVGTMGEFASSFPLVTGLADDLGISFGDLGAAASYITTKGNTASESMTQLSSMMVALIRPNDAMKDALHQIGYESGRAAVASLGLAGTYQRLRRAIGLDALADAVGRVEALRGVTAVTNDTFNTFAADFVDGIDGITQATEDIQLGSLASKFDRLRSNVDGLRIAVGDGLSPAFEQLIDSVTPILMRLTDWAVANPEIIQQFGILAGAALTAGPALIGVGTALKLIGGALSVFTGPIGIAAAALAALGTAYATNFGGFQDTINNLVGTLRGVFEREIVPRIQDFFNWLGGVWETVQPGLHDLAAWFSDASSDGIAGAGAWIQENIMPIIVDFVGLLGDIWARVSPALEKLGSWFITDVLPLVADTINEILLPAVNVVIDILSGIWKVVGPPLGDLANWFVEDALPAITDFLRNVAIPAISDLIKIISGIWSAVEPFLISLRDGISKIFGWIDTNVIQPFMKTVQDLLDMLGIVDSRKSAYDQGSGSGINPDYSYQTFVAGFGVGRSGSIATPQQAFADYIAHSQSINPAYDFFSHRAMGGLVTGGQSYIVGDGGEPEVFTPRQSGMVTPFSKLGTNITINIQMPEAALASPAIATARGRDFGAAVKDELRRRGGGS